MESVGNEASGLRLFLHASLRSAQDSMKQIRAVRGCAARRAWGFLYRDRPPFGNVVLPHIFTLLISPDFPKQFTVEVLEWVLMSALFGSLCSHALNSLHLSPSSGHFSPSWGSE